MSDREKQPTEIELAAKKFEFCTKAQTGKRIIEILNGGMTHG